MRIPSIALLFALAVAAGCSQPEKASTKPQLTYDKTTGKLKVITSDLGHRGRPDTWTYMDGTTILRSEQDLDGDGKIDRWEYNAPDGTVLKVALSTRKTGTPDKWIYTDPADRKQMLRVESSSKGDEKRIDHWEYYERGKLVRTADDTDGDGRPDKWEEHDGAAILLSAEYDRDKDGVRDVRYVYDRSGRVVTIETKPDGRGGYRKIEPVKWP